jgi:uncharacterized membrane protein
MTIPDERQPHSTVTDRPSRPNTTRSLIRLWIPTDPGAWTIAMMPAIAGALIGGGSWRAWWTVIAWALCYCTQFTVSRWLFSHRRRRYLAPAITHTVLLAVVGLPLVALTPELLWWAPLYAALLALSWFAAARRAERSLWGNAVSVVAACAMAIVICSMGSGAQADSPAAPSIATAGLITAAVFLLYDYGSVLFVKTMMRERGKRSYYIASVTWSIAFAAVATALHPALGIVAALPLLRAVVLPVLLAQKRIKPIAAAPTEVVTSLAIFIAVIIIVPQIG